MPTRRRGRPASIIARLSPHWMLSILLTVAGGSALADDTAASAPPRTWLQNLCLGNEGYWRQRLRIVARNDSDSPLAGHPSSAGRSQQAAC
jgi:hypothetical protein